jgi:hypothetical protein
MNPVSQQSPTCELGTGEVITLSVYPLRSWFIPTWPHSWIRYARSADLDRTYCGSCRGIATATSTVWVRKQSANKKRPRGSLAWMWKFKIPAQSEVSRFSQTTSITFLHAPGSPATPQIYGYWHARKARLLTSPYKARCRSVYISFGIA